MTTRFGFDDAGVGFDQAPFASIYADIEVQAGKTLPAFSASVTLSKDRRLHVEVEPHLPCLQRTFPVARLS